jgi:hypothetical protein
MLIENLRPCTARILGDDCLLPTFYAIRSITYNQHNPQPPNTVLG